MPINSDNLVDYYANAIIYPAKYLTGRIFDVQNKFENSIVLTSKQGIGETNCSLEIVLSQNEEQTLEALSSDCWIFPKPLPITRIKKICFNEKELSEHCVTAIELNTAFIPNKLVDVIAFEYAESNNWKNIEEEKVDWTPKIRMFDRVLGGLALMRLAREGEMNFSENYFSMLGEYNDEIVLQMKNYNIVYKPDLYRDGYFVHVNKCITGKIDNHILDKIVHLENQKLIKHKTTRRIEIESLNDASYILAILRNYKVNESDDGRDNIDSLILNGFSSLKKGKTEEVAFYYGLNRGYRAFTKSYKDVEFKYRLETKLDYYTIESIYQKAINDVPKSAKFPYLDDWCPNKLDEVSNFTYNKYENRFIIMDTVVFGKKKAKVLSEEYFNDSYLWFFEKIKGIGSGLVKGESLPNLIQDLWSAIVVKISDDLEIEFGQRLEEGRAKNEEHILTTHTDEIKILKARIAELEAHSQLGMVTVSDNDKNNTKLQITFDSNSKSNTSE